MTPSLLDHANQHREGGWNPANGVHAVVVHEGEAFESKAGNLIAKLVLELVEEADAGQRFDAIFFLGGKMLGKNAGDLSVAGVGEEALALIDPGDFGTVEIDVLDRSLRGLAGRRLEVSTKERDDGDGVWVDVLSSRNGGPSDVPADTAGLGDDDVPF